MCTTLSITSLLALLLAYNFYSPETVSESSDGSDVKDFEQYWALPEEVFPIYLDELDQSKINQENEFALETGNKNILVGFNLPYLTPIHQKALRNTKGRIVVDCGAADGLFTAKLLVNQPDHVYAIELMPAGAKNIPQTIQHYQTRLSKNIGRHGTAFTVYQNDVLDGLEKIRNTGDQPDQFCFFNIFHYMHPEQVEEVLEKSFEIAAEGASLYGTASAMVNRKHTHRLYEQQQSNRGLFAGYMMWNRVSPVFEWNKANKEWVKVPHTSTLIVDVSPLKPSDRISPIHVWNGFYDPVKHYTPEKKKTFQKQLKTFTENGITFMREVDCHAFFLIDAISIRHLLESTGWTVVEITYLSDQSTIFQTIEAPESLSFKEYPEDHWVIQFHAVKKTN